MICYPFRLHTCGSNMPRKGEAPWATLHAKRTVDGYVGELTKLA